ncbi:MAG: flagellar filament capping protein FliD [Proteobacteria bacterium]|nr:flagellar filament capping protein FliD [Pseudomonadota bacterium]
MTASSATSSIVSTLGAGSGIDMAALATGLAQAQFAGRVDRNSAQADAVDRQISAASALKNLVTQMVSGISDRIRTGDMARQPIIANTSVAAVSRGAGAGSGSYSLEVTALARAQTLTSPAFTAVNTPVGSGTLTLRFGAINGGTFSESTGKPPVSIAIPAGATLADTAAAITASGAGVSAYVANGADGAHLMLKGQDGAASGFIIEASETPGDPGLSALAWNPGGDPARLLAGAGDAAFTFDGLAMTAPSNTITDIAPGLSLSLNSVNPGAPTTIRFNDPSNSVTSFMTDLTAALNEVAAELNKDIAPQGGDLNRDDGARLLRRTLSALAGTTVMPNAAPGEPATLADLGLATNRDGTFRLDTARLTATLKSSPTGASAMFTTGLFGVLATFDKLGRAATTTASTGSLGGSLARYTALKSKLGTEKTTLADAQEKLRSQLVTRFAGVDSRVGTSRSTLSFLQNQIAAWNAQKG